MGSPLIGQWLRTFALCSIALLVVCSTAQTTYTNQEILTVVIVVDNPPIASASNYDAPGNAYQRPWTDVTLWYANGTAAKQIPGAGDVVSADFSSSLCTQGTPPVYHAAASIKNYSTPRLSSVTLSNSQKCRATVRVYSDGVLNADTIVIKSGVQFVLDGTVNCNSFTLESGAMIFGSGFVNCASITLSGDVAPGWMYWAAVDKGRPTSMTFDEYSDCAPSYVPPKTGTWTTNTSMGQSLTFGGTSVVNGNIWIDYRGDWNRVFFDAVLFSFPATVHVWQSYGNTLNVSVSCVFFNSLAGPANVTTATATYVGLIAELPWVNHCINICGQVNCMGFQGSCFDCPPAPNSPCASSTPTSISVLVNPVAQSDCSATLFLAVASTGITTSGTTANGTAAVTTAPTQASSGLSTVGIIMIATIIPGVLLAAGLAVLLVLLRKRELAKRQTAFNSKQASKLTD